MNPRCFISIEIGGTKLQVLSLTEEFEILDRRRFVVDTASGAEGIRTHIASVLPELIGRSKAVAVGVGYGGPVDWKSGRIARSYHVSGWSAFPLAEWLREKTGLPAFVENDSNAAAVGEALVGAGKGETHVLYSNSGSGVGAGFVTHGRLYRGARNTEMELGHIRLDMQGTIVEQRCAGWALDRRIREGMQAHPDSVLARLHGDQKPGGEARHLVEATRLGDLPATRLLLETARSYAFALSHAVHLLSPSMIVLGGGVAQIGEPWREAVSAALYSFVMDALLPPPEVRLAELGEDTVPIGAMLLAAQRLDA